MTEDDDHQADTAAALHWAMRQQEGGSSAVIGVPASATAAVQVATRRRSAGESLRRFVEHAYQLLLDRPADPAGLAHQLEYLNRGGTRAGVLDGLARSAEGSALREDVSAQGRAGAVARRLGIDAGRTARLEAHLVSLFASVLDGTAAQAQRSSVLESLLAHQQERLGDDLQRQREQVERELAEQRSALSALRDLAERSAGELAATRLGVEQLRVGPRAVLSNGQVSVVQLDGLLVAVPAAEWRLAAFMSTSGNLEPGLTRRFLEVVQPGDTVVDVGANVGMYTLHAARAVGARGAVHAVEPTPSVHALLAQNVQLNGFRESGVVRLHELALGEAEGEAELAVYEDNNGHNSLFPKDADDVVVRVPVRTLDSVVGAGAVVDVVKIDVEGAELLVLRGMAATAERNPGVVVFCELAPEHLARTGSSPRQFLDDVSALGWVPRVVEDVTGDVRDLREEDLTAPTRNLELVRR